MNTHRELTPYEISQPPSLEARAEPPRRPAAPPPEPPAAFEVDLMEIFRAIWRRRWTVLTAMFVGGLLSVLIALILPKTYTSVAQVMLETRTSNVTGAEAVLGDLTPTAEVVETEIQVVVSRSIKEQVARELGLIDLLERRAAEAEQSAVNRWLVGAGTWLAGVLPPSAVEALRIDRLIERQPASLEGAIEFLDFNLSAGQIGATAVIQIAMQDSDPNVAAAIANAVVDRYLQNQVEYKSSTTQIANAWLEERIGELRGELAAKRAELQQARAESGVVDGGGASVLADRQILTNERLLEARSERIRLQSEVDRMRQALRTGGVGALAAMFENEVLEELRLELAEANRELAELAAIYGPRHPRYLDTQSNLERTQANLEREARASLASRESALAAARTEERELSRELDTYVAAGRQAGGQRSAVEALEGEIAAMQEVLDGYLSRQTETSEQTAIIRPDARTITEATPPLYPDPPSSMLIVLLGLFVSGGVGMIWAYMRDALDRSIRSVGEAERVLQIPVLAALPQLPKTGGKPTPPADYIVQRPASAYAETVRTMLTNMGVAKGAGATRRLLVTSALPGEGKSSTSASIARVLRRADLSVALVDCDMRRPSLAPALRCANQPGLLQYLSGGYGFEEITQIDPATGLTFVAAGGGTDNSLFMLQSEKMRRLAETLESQHEFVIYDSPPVHLLSDAQALAEHVDAVLFLCRWGHTARAASSAAVRMLVRRGGPTVYGALSIADPKKLGNYDNTYYDSKAASRYYVD